MSCVQEFYEITFGKNISRELEVLQADLDTWVDSYNIEGCHQGNIHVLWKNSRCKRCSMDMNGGKRRSVC